MSVQRRVATMLAMWKVVNAGLADLDPDIDAVARMTRKGGLFNKHMVPVALPAGTLTPFNSQNTVFLYEAMWGLLIPITTTFRYCKQPLSCSWAHGLPALVLHL